MPSCIETESSQQLRKLSRRELQQSVKEMISNGRIRCCFLNDVNDLPAKKELITKFQSEIVEQTSCSGVIGVVFINKSSSQSLGKARKAIIENDDLKKSKNDEFKNQIKRKLCLEREIPKTIYFSDWGKQESDICIKECLKHGMTSYDNGLLSSSQHEYEILSSDYASDNEELIHDITKHINEMLPTKMTLRGKQYSRSLAETKHGKYENRNNFIEKGNNQTKNRNNTLLSRAKSAVSSKVNKKSISAQTNSKSVERKNDTAPGSETSTTNVSETSSKFQRLKGAAQNAFKIPISNPITRMKNEETAQEKSSTSGRVKNVFKIRPATSTTSESQSDVQGKTKLSPFAKLKGTASNVLNMSPSKSSAKKEDNKEQSTGKLSLLGKVKGAAKKTLGVSQSKKTEEGDSSHVKDGRINLKGDATSETKKQKLFSDRIMTELPWGDKKNEKEDASKKNIVGIDKKVETTQNKKVDTTQIKKVDGPNDRITEISKRNSAKIKNIRAPVIQHYPMVTPNHFRGIEPFIPDFNGNLYPGYCRKHIKAPDTSSSSSEDYYCRKQKKKRKRHHCHRSHRRLESDISFSYTDTDSSMADFLQERRLLHKLNLEDLFKSEVTSKHVRLLKRICDGF